MKTVTINFLQNSFIFSDYLLSHFPVAIFELNNYNIAVEKRRSKRIKVNLKAERISGNEKYGVFIENISENGINITTTSSNVHKNYNPGTDVDLKFRLSSGETIDLRCKIKWLHLKIPTNGHTDCIGLEIIDPPSQYIKFVKALH